MVFVAAAGLSGLLLATAWIVHDGPPWWPAVAALSSLAFSLAAHALLHNIEIISGSQAPAGSGTDWIADRHTRAAALRLLGKGFEDLPDIQAAAPLPAWPLPRPFPRDWRQTGPLVWYADTH